MVRRDSAECAACGHVARPGAKCPSGVAFGPLMEQAHAGLADRQRSTGWRGLAASVGIWTLSAAGAGGGDRGAPEFSDALGKMKAEAVGRSGCRTVAVANPGCALQLARGGFTMVRPAQLLAAALPAPGDSRRER